MRDRLPKSLLLTRPERFSVWQSLALRGLFVLALFGIALAGHWLDRTGLRDSSDNHVSFVDVVYFTAVTVTTVGYGDIVPVTPRARLFDTFVVTPVRIFVWLIFLGTAYAFVFQHVLDRARSVMIARGLCDHIVLCGFGASGEAAARDLLQQGVSPETVLAIDLDPVRTALARELGIVALTGDATHNDVLQTACIARAKAVLVSVARDDTAALAVLSARQLSPHVSISASVRAPENEDLLRQAGAGCVINPVSIGGHLLARSSVDGEAVEFVRDMISAQGRVVIRERAPTKDEIGMSLRDIRGSVGVRIVRRGEPIGYWEPGAAAIEQGDTLVEIVRIAGEPIA